MNIDLSEGWDEKELNKMIRELPCSEKDKQEMRRSGKILRMVEYSIKESEDYEEED